MPPPDAPRLLILDDEVALGMVLSRIAERSGWSVQTAVTTAEFQSLFSGTSPDLIMLDLQLGTSDGVEQLRFLHEQAYGGAIVLMSGFADRVLSATSDLGRSLGLAIVGTLSKPASNDQIKDLLSTLAPIRRSARPAPVVSSERDAEPDELSPASVDAAVSRGELGIVFQPIVSSATGHVEMFEVLSRWHHPTRGTVMPDEFIPVGERDAGVIDRLTRWVVETAGTQSRCMGELGIPGQVAVNLSAKNLREVDFPDRLVDQLAAIGVAPATMTLEITETAATGDPTITTDILARLRLKGFQLAMDDFGTGFASMKALLNSPFSKLKIDKSFVSRLPVSRDARLIVKSVARMARDMGLQTVAEGVETKEIVDQLDAFGIDSVQGYYVGRPMGVERIRGWLDDWTQQRKPLQSADRV